jgi:thiamine pyrophosphokinase
MKRAIILANGDAPSRMLLRAHLRNADILICADGGANTAAKLNVRPDVILGDMDSMLEASLKKFKKVKVIRMRDQNSTDLEKALSFAVRKGYGAITVFGATGRRIDHELGNLSALVKFSRKAEVKFVDRNGELLCLAKKESLALSAGRTISLLPLTSCEGVATTGLHWNLRNETLRFGLRESTSNVVAANPITICHRKGELVLFVKKTLSVSRYQKAKQNNSKQK